MMIGESSHTDHSVHDGYCYTCQRWLDFALDFGLRDVWPVICPRGAQVCRFANGAIVLTLQGAIVSPQIIFR